MQMTRAARQGNHAGGHGDDLDDLKRYARRSDPDALATVASRYRAMVLATCRRVLENEADAQDAMQETFLKLARNAGHVRTNLAAWLHACAVRVSLDMIRREKARRSAERQPAADRHGSTGDAEMTWREIEPEVDAALYELGEADRELIVSRYFLGRSQRELARESGVSDGTLSRRLERAVSRLRKKLEARGVTSAGIVTFTGALCMGVEKADAALAPEISKIALTGVGGRPPPLLASLPLGLTGAVASVFMLAGVAGVSLLTGPQPGSMTAAEAADAVELPDGKGMRYGLISFHSPAWEASTLACAHDRMIFELSDDWRDRAGRIELRVRSAKERDEPEGTLRVDAVRVNVPDSTVFAGLQGRQATLSYRLDEIGRLFITGDVRVRDATRNIRWVGTRPRDFSGEASPRSAEFQVRELAGAWVEMYPWDLRLGPENIEILQGSFAVHRFRVLELADVGDHTRVEAIVIDSADPRIVGDRIKLLLREQGDTRTLVFHAKGSGSFEEWPDGFTPGSGADDKRRVMIFRKRP